MWTSDPRHLYMGIVGNDGVTRGLGMVDFDPDRGERLSDIRRVTFEPGADAWFGLATFTPDHRWMFFDWTEQQGDIYVANLIVK